MFRRQLRGLACMLVADADGYSVGQAWVEYPSTDTRFGGIWAVRVFPCLQSHGIGTLLINAAETLLASRGALGVEMEVHRQNHAARRLYEQLGYQSPRPALSVRLCDFPGPPASGQVLLRKLLTPPHTHEGFQPGEVA
jgi:GNAT superfamily N-acetyltransferase